MILSKNKQIIIAGLLLVIMLASRAEVIPYFQDASWAMLFALGFYIRPYFAIALFLIAIMGIDFAQIAARGGHQDYYLSPSYLFIIPAYFSLWWAGRFFSKRYSDDLKGLILFITCSVMGIIICHLISAAGYYWMSMKFINLSLDEFISRTLDFLPLALQVNLMYLSVIALLHLSFSKIHKHKMS